ncbi:fimbrial protein [Dyella caseinilytica]|uniref:Fimbrial protein n=1 Tax=Dyella caseinilytica TaxID=1849581 RepID=A0ABX7GSS3_9GAMM|nr:fimbrial protein [Dyella caseinilytica]QRN52842.1 fimbrial protein [Dyella caseinilytica]
MTTYLTPPSQNYEVAIGASRWMRIALATFALLLLGTAKTAFAAGNCQYTSTTPTWVTQVGTLSGSATVGRDAPIGTVIYEMGYASSVVPTLLCTAGSYQVQTSLVSQPYPLSSYVDPSGYPVYQTAIPGIGVRINGATTPVPGHGGIVNYPAPSNPISFTNGSNFRLDLIKISSTVGAGTITAAGLPTFQTSEVSMDGGNSTRFLLATVIGQVSIISSTCTTPNVSVNLGAHLTTELRGVGTTTATWVPVNIRLNNCPAFFGSTYTTFNADTSRTTTGTLAQNSIGYSVNPTNGVANATNGVMNLSSGGATGIGIQLANSSGTPVQFNTATPSGLTLNQTSSANYTISLQARYYQTGASITAGAANATATVTLSYL